MVRGKNTDDGVGMAVETETASEDIGISSKPLLPETMADHSESGTALRIDLAGGERASHRERRLQHVEKIRGDDQRDQIDGGVRTAPVHVGFNLVASQAVERMALLEHLPLAIRHVAAAVDADAHE